MIAIGIWKETENEMAVLSTYPNKVEQRGDQHNAPGRCSTVFTGEGRETVVGGGNSAINNEVDYEKPPVMVKTFASLYFCSREI